MLKIPPFFETYLFDMDGTLVDTEPVGPEVFIKLFSKYGVVLTEDEKSLFIKVWRRTCTDIKENDYLTDLVHKYSLKIEPESFIQEFYDSYEVEIVEAKELPGVNEFLNSAYNHKKKLILVTSSTKEQAAAVLDCHNWTGIFSGIVSAEDISNFKPNPEPYILGAQKATSDVNKCVVFEDAATGVAAGKAAGMFVVGLRAGNEEEQNLSNADAVAISFRDIVA